MPATSALILIKEFNESWRRYGKVHKRAAAEMTEESVHDLRVALRRLDATLSLIALFTPESYTRKTRKRLTAMRKQLNPLRDVQVQSLQVADLANTYPVLKQFQKRLSKREQSLLRDLKKDLESEQEKLETAFSATVSRSR